MPTLSSRQRRQRARRSRITPIFSLPAFPPGRFVRGKSREKRNSQDVSGRLHCWKRLFRSPSMCEGPRNPASLPMEIEDTRRDRVMLGEGAHETVPHCRTWRYLVKRRDSGARSDIRNRKSGAYSEKKMSTLRSFFEEDSLWPVSPSLTATMEIRDPSIPFSIRYFLTASQRELARIAL